MDTCLRNIFDSHAHYDSPKFRGDRHGLLASLPARGVSGIVNAASNLAGAREGLRLAARYKYLYCAAGIHPHDAKDAPADYLLQLRELLAQPKIVALGEIGLDYHYDFSPREAQRRLFEEQLALAGELELPVIVHDREAHADTLALLQKYRPRGVVHCFSGSAEMARQVAALGMYIGFTGVITFKNARQPLEALRAVPRKRLLIETDAPYMAPEPYRGRRCDSSMLTEVVRVVSRELGVSPQEAADTTAENAARLFNIPL